MRWDNLFDDLEGQLEHGLDAESGDLRAEEERLRLGRLTLRARLVSLTRAPGAAAVVRIVLGTGQTVTLRPTTFGRDWLAADILGSPGGFHHCVLPLHAIASVLLSAEEVADSLSSEPDSAARVVERIGLPFVLRDLCRRRARVEILTTSGSLGGTVDRVGRDHFDLAVHPPETSRRAREVTHYRIVPFEEIQLVRLH